MLKLIAESPAWQEPGHKTPEEAMAYAQACETAFRSTNKAMSGAKVDRVLFNDIILQIMTDKGDFAVDVRSKRLKHSLLDDTNTCLTSANESIGAFAVTLGDLNFVWDRTGIAEAIIGTTFEMVGGSPHRIWLYFSSIGIVMASMLINKTTGEPFVYWDYSD